FTSDISNPFPFFLPAAIYGNTFAMWLFHAFPQPFCSAQSQLPQRINQSLPIFFRDICNSNLHRLLMVLKGLSNQSFASLRQLNHAYPTVTRTFFSLNQTAVSQPVESRRHGSACQHHLSPQLLHSERSFVQERLQHSKVAQTHVQTGDMPMRMRFHCA